MELKDIHPSNVAQMKVNLAGDLTATVALVLTDGTLEVLSDVPLKEAKAFQLEVEATPKEGASEKIHSSTPAAPPDPHENEPGPPVSQTPCSICGLVHSPTGNITCICAFCYELREIVHSGACAACAKQRFGHYFEQLGTPLGSTEPQKPPWAT
jgi:hypothetical protein